MTIGELIKSKRKEKGYSQNELSTLSGVSLSAIQKGENGLRNLKMDSLQKIASALECPINDLLGYKYTPDDIEFLDAPLGDNGELKNFCTLLESLGYEFRENESKYNIFNDKKEIILTCTSEELIEYSSKITNSLKDFLEITIKHLL